MTRAKFKDVANNTTSVPKNNFVSTFDSAENVVADRRFCRNKNSQKYTDDALETYETEKGSCEKSELLSVITCLGNDN